MPTINNNALVPNIGPNTSTSTVASTNPAKNVNPNAGLATGVTGSYDPKTTALTFSGNSIPTQSTTVLSSDKTKDITNLGITAANNAKTGVTTQTNPDGTAVSTTANGAVYAPPKTVVSNVYNADGSSTIKYSDGTESSTPASSNPNSTTPTGGYYNDQYIAPGQPLPKDANGNYVQLTTNLPTDQTNLDTLNANIATSDADTANMISDIKNQYQKLIDMQTKANDASNAATTNFAIMSGRGVASSDDNIHAEITSGINAISDLTDKENAAIHQAQAAGNQNKYKLQEQINTQIEQIRKEKTDAINKVNDSIVQATKDVQTAKDKVTSDINTILEDYYKNGGNDPKVIAQIKGATTQQGAIDAAGSALKTMTGDFADYPQYANDAKANNVPVLSATDWLAKKQKTDATNKANEAYATAFATAKGKSAGEVAAAGANGGLLPVTSTNGVTYNVPASVAPNVKISSNGVKYIDASSLTPAEKGKLTTAAYNGGVNPIPVITDPSKSLDVSNIEDANLKIADMKATFDSIGADSATQRNLYFAAAQTIAKALQTNPNVVAADVYQDAALDILKAMSGTKGFRGGASMVDQVKETFPKATDTKDVIDQKIANMQKLIDDRQVSLIGKPSVGDQAIIDAVNQKKQAATSSTPDLINNILGGNASPQSSASFWSSLIPKK